MALPNLHKPEEFRCSNVDYSRDYTLCLDGLAFLDSPSAIKRELSIQFEQYGQIDRLRLFLDGPSCLKCVVSFYGRDDVDNVLRNSDKIRLFGQPISSRPCPSEDLNRVDEVKDAVYDDQSDASRTLYISNLSDSATKDDIRTVFEEYGHIINVDAARLPLFAFVQFYDIASVVRAINAGRNKIIFGRRLRLNFGKTLRWKSLWIKVNPLSHVNYKNAQTISLVKRYSSPEKFYVDTTYNEMLIFFRRTDDAARAFKQLRSRKTEDGSYIMLDYSSDKMDAYFFNRSNDIDSISYCSSYSSCPRVSYNGVRSDRVSCSTSIDSSSINRVGPSHLDVDTKQTVKEREDLFVIDSSEKVVDLNVVERGRVLTEKLRSRRPKFISRACDVLPVALVKSLYSRDKSPSADVPAVHHSQMQPSSVREDDVQIKNQFPPIVGAWNIPALVSKTASEVIPRTVKKESVNLSKNSKGSSRLSGISTGSEAISEIQSPQQNVRNTVVLPTLKTETTKRPISQMVEVEDDLFTPDNISRPSVQKSKELKTDCATGTPKVSKQNELNLDEGKDGPQKKKRRKHSVIYIDSEEDNSPIPGKKSEVIDDFGISMYDSIKIRRYLSDPNNTDACLPQMQAPLRKQSSVPKKSNKRKFSEKTKLSCVDEEEVTPHNGDTPSTPWRLDLLLNGSGDVSPPHVKLESEIDCPLPEEESTTLEECQLSVPVIPERVDSFPCVAPCANIPTKKKKNVKSKLSTGLSRVIKNNVKLLRNTKMTTIPPDIPVSTLAVPPSSYPCKEILVDNQVTPTVHSSSESTITVVHAEDMACSPVTDSVDCVDIPPTSSPVVIPASSCPSVVTTPNSVSTEGPQSNPVRYAEPVYIQRTVNPICVDFPRYSFANQPFIYQPSISQQGVVDYSTRPPVFYPVQYVPCGPFLQMNDYHLTVRPDGTCFVPISSANMTPANRIPSTHYMTIPSVYPPLIRTIPNVVDSQQAPRFHVENNPRSVVRPPQSVGHNMFEEKERVPTLKGSLKMKSSTALVEYIYLAGIDSFGYSLLSARDLIVPTYQISKRMHLVQPQFDELEKKIKTPNWCGYAVVPQKVGDNETIFGKTLIDYLSSKLTAGIVILNAGNLSGIMYLIPPCAFSRELLSRWTGQESAYTLLKNLFVTIVSEN